MARSPKAPRPTQTARRRMGMPVAAALAPTLAKAAAKRGFKEARLIAEWSTIVGPELAARTRPERMDRRGGIGTLRLIVQRGWSTEVQHSAPLIAERINQHFGYQLVERLTLRQGAIPKARSGGGAGSGAGGGANGPQSPARKPASPETFARLDADCADVADPELAVILQRLGSAVLNRRDEASEPSEPSR